MQINIYIYMANINVYALHESNMFISMGVRPLEGGLLRVVIVALHLRSALSLPVDDWGKITIALRILLIMSVIEGSAKSSFSK